MTAPQENGSPTGRDGFAPASAAAAFVGLGANLGARRAVLSRAVDAIDALARTRVERVSQWYDTAPVGGPADQPRFLNGVARLRTRLTPLGLLFELQRIESEAGRDRAREVRNGPRPLDLDLLMYDTQRRSDPPLELPHPRMEEREFVLRPLAEIAPDLLLLDCGRTAAQRLCELLSC